MLIALLICLGCFLALVTTSRFVGKLLTRGDSSTASQIAIGGFFVTSIYALVIVRGNSQMLGTLLITGLLLLLNKSSVRSSLSSISWNSFFLWTGFAFILPIALHFPSLLDGHTWFLHLDHSYYAQAGDFLNHAGVESPLINYTYPEQAAEVPYHYLDLWQIATFEEITQLPPIFILQHVVQPFWILVLLLAVKEHIHRFVQWQWWHFFFVLSALFVTVWSFTFPRFISSLEHISVFQHTALNYPKLLPIYALLACAFLHFKTNRVLFSWMIAALAITNTTVMPALFLTIGSLMLFEVIRTKKIKKEQWIPVLFMGCYAVFFYIFYFQINSVANESPQYAQPHSQQEDYIQTAINSFAVTLIQAASTSVGYLVILIPFFWRQLLALYQKHAYYLWLIVLITLFGAACYGMLHPTHASIQLWSCIALPVVNLFWFAIIVALFLRSNKLTSRLLLGSLLLFNLVLNLPVQSQHNWNKADFNSVSQFLEGDKQLNCVFFKAPEEFKDAHSLNTFFDKPGEILNYTANQVSIPCLSVLDIEYENIEDADTYAGYTEEVLTSVPFYQFYKSKEALGISVLEAQIDFLTSFEVEYIVCTKQTQLHPKVLELTKDNITLSNGERIYKL